MKEFHWRHPDAPKHDFTHIGRRPSASSTLVSVPCLMERQDADRLHIVPDDDPRPRCPTCFPPVRVDQDRLKSAVANLDPVGQPIKAGEFTRRGGRRTSAFTESSTPDVNSTAWQAPCGIIGSGSKQGLGGHRGSCTQCRAIDGKPPKARRIFNLVSTGKPYDVPNTTPPTPEAPTDRRPPVALPATEPYLVGCARCGGTHHERIEWRRLDRPILDADGTRHTHWAPCPKNGQPILMRVEAA